MSQPVRIVVVEDQVEVRQMVLQVLEEAGFDATGAGDGPAGLAAVRDVRPDLLLLDVRLPGGFSGRDVLRRLRSEAATAHLPIVVLTGQEDDQLELTLLEEGADDYIRKNQFRPRILVERIRAVLRRAGTSAAAKTVRTEHLVIHPARREAIVDGKPVNLTPTEFDILLKLASNPDRALPRREMIDRGGPDGVEGERTDDDQGGDDRTVDVHILSIRRKLGRFAWLVSTVWGVGYRLGSAPGS
jgi:two-component system phosphate regulon response regulator PhoB